LQGGVNEAAHIGKASASVGARIFFISRRVARKENPYLEREFATARW
jgi:hypothetical protein